METTAPTSAIGRAVGAEVRQLDSLGVVTGLDRLTNEVTSLHDVIEALEGRLAPMLRDESSPDAMLAAAVGPCSVVATRVHGDVDRVISASERLRELLRRLDV